MAGTFNQSLQCTQDVFIGFQVPLPPVLVITLIPLLHAPLHLGSIVRGERETLEATTSRNTPRGDEVLERQRGHITFQHTAQLGSSINIECQWVGTTRIVPSTVGVLLVIDRLELFVALHPGVVDILGKGDESRRSRSEGSRHLVVEDRLVV